MQENCSPGCKITKTNSRQITTTKKKKKEFLENIIGKALMETEKILQHLSKEDLPPDLQLIVEHEGIDNVKKILKYWDGFRLTLPKLNFIDTLMEKYIENRYKQKIHPVIIAKEIDRSFKYVDTIIRKLEKKEIRD